jgi:glycosyltransferase involved in cell wall biosynthesis
MKFPDLTIALVGPLPPPSGGMANQTRQLYHLLSTEGVRVDLVQVNAPYRPAWIGRYRGIRAVFRLAPYFISLWRVTGKAQLMHVMANSGWSWHLFAAPAVWIARWRGVPVVINYRGGDAKAFFQRSFRWVYPTMRRAQVIVPSRFLRDVFIEYGVACNIVPNIIDLHRFSKQADAHEVSKVGFPHIIVTRNLEPIYDVGSALKAFRQVLERMPEAHISIAGSGDERPRLESLARELGISERVTFTGRLDNEHMVRLYRSADVMVNTSLVDNMPNSILEALACGIPVVSTNVGGVPYMVNHGEHALLVPPGDPQAMADAVIRLCDESQLKDRMVKAGRDLVSQYSWSNVREKWLSIYTSLLQEYNGN